MGVCNLCYAFCNSPRPRCGVLELAFSNLKAEIRRFSKANGRVNATCNISLLDLLLILYIRGEAAAVFAKL